MTRPRRALVALLAVVMLLFQAVAVTSVAAPVARATSAAPVVNSFSPPSGVFGSHVTINGLNFNGVSAVTFAGIVAQFKTISDHQISAIVPNLTLLATDTYVTLGVANILDGTSGTAPSQFFYLGRLLCGDQEHGGSQWLEEQKLTAIDDTYSRDITDPAADGYAAPTGPLYLDAHVAEMTEASRVHHVLSNDTIFDTFDDPHEDVALADFHHIALEDWYAELFTGPSHAKTFSFHSDGSFDYVPQDGYLGADSFQYVFSDTPASNCSTVGTVHLTKPTQIRPRPDGYQAVENTSLSVGKFCCGLLFDDVIVSVGSAHVTKYDVPGDQVEVQDLKFAPIGPGDTFTLTWALSGGPVETSSIIYSDDMSTAIFDALNAIPTAPTKLKSVVKLDGTEYLITTSLQASNPISITSPTDFSPTAPTAAIQPGLRTYHGTLAMIGFDGSFVYVPDHGFVGADKAEFSTDFTTFTYEASNFSDHDKFPAVPVYISVFPPIVVTPIDDNISLNEDTTLTIFAGDLLGNDQNANYVTCVDGDILTCTPTSLRTEHGSLALTWAFFIEGDLSSGKILQSIVYTPDDDFFGTDSFGYWDAGVVTGHLETSLDIQGRVHLQVNNVDDPPDAQNDAALINPNTPVTIDIAGNDSDPDGDLDPTSPTFWNCGAVCPFPPNGDWVFNGDGTITYTPPPGFAGFAQIFYSISDSTGLVGHAPVSVRVKTAADDSYQTPEDTELDVGFETGVLANDAATSVAPVLTAPEHGELSLSSDGSIAYVPDPDFSGTDTFTYKALGGPDVTPYPFDVATVTINVTPVNDKPNVYANAWCDHSGGPFIICPGADNRDVAEGGDIVLNGAISDTEFDPGILKITWGDGTSTQANYPCSPEAATCPFTDVPTFSSFCLGDGCGVYLFFRFHHTYADNPPGDHYTIVATATEQDTTTNNVTTGARVTNVAPSIALTDSSLEGTTGTPVSLSGRVSDPGPDTGEVKIDWGDGSTDTLPVDCNTSGDLCSLLELQQTVCVPPLDVAKICGYFTKTHTYTGPDVYTIHVTASDDDGDTGNSADATATVTGDACAISGFVPSCAGAVADAQIRRPGGPLVGDNVYNLDGSGQSWVGSPRHYRNGTVRRLYVYAQNDGIDPDSFTMHATGGPSTGYLVRYFKPSGVEITSAVEAGTYSTRELAPGQRVGIRVQIKVLAGAAHGSQVSGLVTSTSVSDDSVADAVGFVLKRL